MLFFMQSYKSAYSLQKMCEVDRLKDLTNFCQEVKKIGYQCKPDYRKLKYHLKLLAELEQQKEFKYYIHDFDMTKPNKHIHYYLD